MAGAGDVAKRGVAYVVRWYVLALRSPVVALVALDGRALAVRSPVAYAKHVCGFAQ